MFLSRVELGKRAEGNEAFWREVSRPYGAHQAIWRLFGRGETQKRDFLYRGEEVAGRPTFLVLSAGEPVVPRDGVWQVQTKPFAPALRPGQRLGFRLRASPVVRRATGGGGERGRGQRHDVVMDRKKRLAADGGALISDADLVREAGLAWLGRQGDHGGFRLVTAPMESIGEDGLLEAGPEPTHAVRVDGYRQHRIVRRGEQPIRFSSLDYEGILEVVDPDAFLAQVRAGIGPQKAFGCGLMLLRRA